MTKVICFIAIAVFLGGIFSPLDSLTIEEYGFGSGLLHGLNFWGAWIAKFFIHNKAVMAINKTVFYIVGFAIGVIISIIISFFILMGLILD